MKILIVHQGYEMYGSDRMLLLSLTAIRDVYPDAFIEVWIPQRGSLSKEIEKCNLADKLTIRNLGVIRKSDIKRGNFTILYYLTLGLWNTYKEIKEFKLVYINSVVILDFLILSIFIRNKFILHIHEMPVGLSNLFFKSLVHFSRAKIIAISNEVKKHFKRLDTFVLPNGVIGYPMVNEKEKVSKIKLLIIGRINGWKGQDFFLNSFSKLTPEIKSCYDIRIVGDVFENQVQYRKILEDLVICHNLSNQIHFYPFVKDPGFHYHWADVVIIPSIKPEPFGLVVIEGMSASCAILAANHGGLKDIIDDQVNGWFFEPNNENDLLSKLRFICANNKNISGIGANGRRKFEMFFSKSAYIDRLGNYLKDGSNVT